MNGATNSNFIWSQRVTSPVEIETYGLMIRSISFEINIDRTNACSDVRRDKKEVSAMRTTGPLIMVKDPTGRIVGIVTVDR